MSRAGQSCGFGRCRTVGQNVSRPIFAERLPPPGLSTRASARSSRASVRQSRKCSRNAGRRFSTPALHIAGSEHRLLYSSPSAIHERRRTTVAECNAEYLFSVRPRCVLRRAVRLPREAVPRADAEFETRKCRRAWLRPIERQSVSVCRAPAGPDTRHFLCPTHCRSRRRPFRSRHYYPASRWSRGPRCWQCCLICSAR